MCQLLGLRLLGLIFRSFLSFPCLGLVADAVSGFFPLQGFPLRRLSRVRLLSTPLLLYMEIL